MIDRNRIYMLVVVGCVALVVAAEVLAPEPVDWTPSFVEDDARPYGSRVLFEQLPVLVGEGRVRRAEAPVYRTLEGGRAAPESYVFVSSTLELHDLEAERLLAFVRNGGVVFAAATSFGGLLADTLGVATAPHAPPTDSTVLRFVNPALQPPTRFSFRSDVGRSVFSRFDTSRTTVLGIDGAGSPTFVRTAFGDGAFFLSSTPRAFTNYAMLYGDGAGYVYRALAYLPEGTMWWDAFYKPVRTQATTPLRYLLSEEALRWAYFVGLGALLLFVANQARRRQRPIPVEEPPQNATRAFVETVGRLYYRHGDHADLARKKVAYFHDYLRHRLNIRAGELGPHDETLIADVAARSGVPPGDVAALFEVVQWAEQREQLTEDELLRLTRCIDAFYEQSVR